MSGGLHLGRSQRLQEWRDGMRGAPPRGLLHPVRPVQHFARHPELRHLRTNAVWSGSRALSAEPQLSNDRTRAARSDAVRAERVLLRKPTEPRVLATEPARHLLQQLFTLNLRRTRRLEPAAGPARTARLGSALGSANHQAFEK